LELIKVFLKTRFRLLLCLYLRLSNNNSNNSNSRNMTTLFHLWLQPRHDRLSVYRQLQEHQEKVQQLRMHFKASNDTSSSNCLHRHPTCLTLQLRPTAVLLVPKGILHT
jgi:hypothetical protein